MINYNGILLIDKPQGWTSTDVVRKVVRLTHAKVGQMGTLDPMATGVLPVALGKATKLFDTFLTKKKRYIGSFDFGALYDTQDVTGEIVDKSDFVPTREDLEKSITKFVGEISQIPPAYSAKKVNGIPAYKLARLKQEFELKPKNSIFTTLNCSNLIAVISHLTSHARRARIFVRWAWTSRRTRVQWWQ